MSDECKDRCIAKLTRQIDEANERIGTLTIERNRLINELTVTRIQRDTNAMYGSKGMAP